MITIHEEKTGKYAKNVNAFYFFLSTPYIAFMRKTQIKVTLKNSIEICFVLFGGLWGSHSGCFEKHANNSLYHFCMPARVRVLYTDDLIYILLQCCECTIGLSPFYSWGNWGPERLPDLSKVIQLGGTGGWNLRPDSLAWYTVFMPKLVCIWRVAQTFHRMFI